MLLMTMVLALAGSVAGRDWTAGMFPFHYATEDVVRLPSGSACKFILCPVNGLMAYGRDCLAVPEYPEGGAGESRLALLETGLEALVAGDFTTWGQLTALRLEMNAALRTIEPRVFFTLTSLTNLSISNNPVLGTLHPEVFEGLYHLKELRFVNNNLKTLFEFTLAARPFILGSLVYLDLSENPIQKVTKQDFIEMEETSLEILKMKLCGLSYIEPNSFYALRKLKNLDLSGNNLVSDNLIEVIESVRLMSIPLERLDISGNLINKNIYSLLDVISYTSVNSLDISNNHFDKLNSNFFPNMPNIESLYIRELTAYNIEEETFSKALFPNLKQLSLAGNRLPGFIAGLRIPTLKELDLSENNCLDCSVVPHTSFTSLFQINENELKVMKSLEVLTLSKNNIFHITRFMFFGLESLRALYLSNCTIYSIEEYSFGDLSRLEHLDLSKNNFPHFERLTPLTFDGLSNLTSLRLDSSYITSLNPDMFTYLTNLKYLTLMDNGIVEIDPSTFVPLTNLVRLDLSNNVILPWKYKLFSGNNELETLSVASNHLYKFTPEMIKDFARITFINMRYNPLKCNCELVRNILDSGEYSENFFGLNDTAVKCVSPRKWSDVQVIEFVELNSINYNCMHWSLYLFIISACVLFTFIICSVGIYYLRWYLRYWIFLLKQALRAQFPRRKSDRSNSKYKYDAFVSYSNEDRNFVIRMVAMMENYEPFFRLCVFERDFNAGEVICESVVDCLAVSKKTILILTDAFARSQWCQWELQMAHHKRFFFKSESQDSLILIKLGDIMDAHMTPTLRYLMKTRIYLQWYPDPKRQRIFWQKLREALQSRGDEEIHI